jgi:hypothetical protein
VRLKLTHKSTLSVFNAWPPCAWNHSAHAPQMADDPTISVASKVAVNRNELAALMDIA